MNKKNICKQSFLCGYSPNYVLRGEEGKLGADRDGKVIADLLKLASKDQETANLASFIKCVNELVGKKFEILEGEIHDFSPRITDQPFTTKPLRLQVIWNSHNYETECKIILEILNCQCKYGAFKIDKIIKDRILGNDK